MQLLLHVYATCAQCCHSTSKCIINLLMHTNIKRLMQV